MRAIVIRLFAAVILVGQFQWVPAALTCHRQARMPASHCQDAAPVTGATVRAMPESGTAPCALMVGCVPLVPQVVRPVAAALPHGLEVAMRASAGAPALRSFLSPPLSPPPQA